MIGKSNPEGLCCSNVLIEVVLTHGCTKVRKVGFDARSVVIMPG